MFLIGLSIWVKIKFSVLYWRGGSKILYNVNGGAVRTYVRYGTYESGFRTAYGDALLDGYVNFPVLENCW
jgi:hypothetical protein